MSVIHSEDVTFKLHRLLSDSYFFSYLIMISFDQLPRKTQDEPLVQFKDQLTQVSTTHDDSDDGRLAATDKYVKGVAAL